jgi:hypothetical protein
LKNILDMLNSPKRGDDQRPGSKLALETAARTTLRRAVGLARAGDCQRARELCAAVVFAIQPLIVAREELLRITLHALLVARGFKQLSRLVASMSGTDVKITLMKSRGGGAAPTCHTEPRGPIVYNVDPRWLAELSPDDVFLRRWSDALAKRRYDHPDTTVRERLGHYPQPV